MLLAALATRPGRGLAACFLVLAAFAAAPRADAGPVTCATTNVQASGVSGICQAFSGNDHVNSPLTVNTVNGSAGAHGHNDWIYLQKENMPGGLETNTDAGLDVTGNAQLKSGTWSVDADFLDDYDDFLIVLKGGNAFVAWFFDDASAADGGTWRITGNSSLSHLTIYARGERTTRIPEPATLSLLSIGLLGLVVRRVRNR